MSEVRGVDIRRVLEIIDQENERLCGWHRCRDIAIRERALEIEFRTEMIAAAYYAVDGIFCRDHTTRRAVDR